MSDETTEGLDPKTARQVLDNLFDWLGQRTLLMNTHRLQGLSAMDEILLLEDGRISERGDHQTLMALQGRYYYYHQQHRILDDALQSLE